MFFLFFVIPSGESTYTKVHVFQNRAYIFFSLTLMPILHEFNLIAYFPKYEKLRLFAAGFCYVARLSASYKYLIKQRILSLFSQSSYRILTLTAQANYYYFFFNLNVSLWLFFHSIISLIAELLATKVTQNAEWENMPFLCWKAYN